MNKYYSLDELFLAAVKKDNIDEVKSLLSLGVDVNYNDDESLFQAVIRNHLSIAQFLLENGANIHCRYDSILHILSWNDNPKMTNLFIKYGARFSLYNKSLLRDPVYQEGL